MYGYFKEKINVTHFWEFRVKSSNVNNAGLQGLYYDFVFYIYTGWKTER